MSWASLSCASMLAAFTARSLKFRIISSRSALDFSSFFCLSSNISYRSCCHGDISVVVSVSGCIRLFHVSLIHRESRRLTPFPLTFCLTISSWISFHEVKSPPSTSIVILRVLRDTLGAQKEGHGMRWFLIQTSVSWPSTRVSATSDGVEKPGSHPWVWEAFQSLRLHLNLFALLFYL